MALGLFYTTVSLTIMIIDVGQSLHTAEGLPAEWNLAT